MEDVAGAKATVFFFSSSECPIAQKYVGRFIRLSQDYAPKGVRFFLVNSHAADTAAAWKKRTPFGA